MNYKGVSIAIVTSLMLFTTGCGKVNTLDITDYAVISESGKNGEGTIIYEIDYDRFVNENLSSFNLKKSSKESLIADLENSLTLNVDKENALTNGDEITVSWEIANAKTLKKKYKVEIEGEDTIYIVNDLIEMIELDPFEYIEVILKGDEPTYKVLNPDNDETIKILERYFSPSYLNSKGEIVPEVPQYNGSKNWSFTYALNENDIEFLTKNGIEPTVTEKTYQLSDDKRTFEVKE